MVMDTQPVLTGALVRLTPLRDADFPVLYECASDPLIWEQHPEPLRYTKPIFEKYFQTILSSGGALGIVDRASERLIGASTYYDYDAVQHSVKIGYTFLARAFWGRGYNREAKGLMLNHAFRYVDRVLFEVGARNVRSQKALRHIGAMLVSESKLPGLDGAPIDCLIFTIQK